MDVRFIFRPKILNRADHRLRGRFSQTAERCFRYRVGKFKQQFNISILTLPIHDAFQDVQHSFRSLAAGDAFSARLILRKIHKEARDFDHAGVGVHDHKTAGADHRTRIFHGIKIQRKF